MSAISPYADDVVVYGRDWCEDTVATREQLAALGIAYRYVNTELDPRGEEWVKQQNHGKVKTPTLDLRGRVLIVPSEQELEAAVREVGVGSQ